MDALLVLTVVTSINHGAAKKQDDLHVLAVATNINHGTATHYRTKHQSWSCDKLDDLQMLTVAARNCMIYE